MIQTTRGRAHTHTHTCDNSQIMLNLIVACEESQIVCKAFRNLGHNAYSCDLQKCGRNANPAWHIQGDCMPYLEGKTSFQTQDGCRHDVGEWHLIIAHPPCTYLSKVGAVHMFKDGTYYIDDGDGLKLVVRSWYELLLEARSFFLRCLRAKAKYVAVENPIPMKLARLPHPTTYVEPYWYGEPLSKKTLLWLRNLPPLMAEMCESHYRSLMKCRSGKYRSRTSEGIANAMARQWSAYIVDEMQGCK